MLFAVFLVGVCVCTDEELKVGVFVPTKNQWKLESGLLVTGLDERGETILVTAGMNERKLEFCAILCNTCNKFSRYKRSSLYEEDWIIRSDGSTHLSNPEQLETDRALPLALCIRVSPVFGECTTKKRIQLR